MNWCIRKCEEKDLPVLIEFCVAHAKFEDAHYSTEGKFEKLKVGILGEDPQLWCYVIEMDGILGGYFSYTFDFSTWDAQRFLHLDCLYLEPAFRDKKIGEKVMEYLMAIALKNNCVNVQWQTPAFNKRAIKFYKKTGGTGKLKMRFSLDCPLT